MHNLIQLLKRVRRYFRGVVAFCLHPGSEAWEWVRRGKGQLAREYLTEIFPHASAADVVLKSCFRARYDTNLDIHELVVLIGIAKTLSRNRKQGLRILEIGTFNGLTSLNLAVNLGNAKITTVDLPEDWDGGFSIQRPSISRRNVTDLGRVGEFFKNTEYEASIRQIRCDSADLQWSKLGAPFDLIFIDGNHSYAYVDSDSRNAFANVAMGGCIVWHDYGQIFDVTRAVDEFSQGCALRAIRGTRFAIFESGRGASS